MPADEVGQCHHHAPLSTLLLSAVHPVTLYTHSAKHRATANASHPSTLSLPFPSALPRERRALHTTVLVQQ
jgi:hypothetical protein